MEILEMNALIIHFVQVWCLDDLVAIPPKITIPLVISEDDNDVRAFPVEPSGRSDCAEGRNYRNCRYNDFLHFTFL